MLLKAIKYFTYIKLYFNKLPKDVQFEFLDSLESTYKIARLASHVDLSNL